MKEISAQACRAMIITILLNLMIGCQYCWGVISPIYQERYGWSEAQAALPYTVMTVMVATGGVLTGLLGERYDQRKILFCGGVLLFCGISLTAVCDSLIHACIGFGGLLGIASPMIVCITTPIAVKLFPPNRSGLASGLGGMCMGLSPIYMAPLIETLTARLGTSQGLLLIATVCGGIVCIGALFMPHPPREPIPVRTGDAATDEGGPCRITRVDQALKTRATPHK